MRASLCPQTERVEPPTTRPNDISSRCRGERVATVSEGWNFRVTTIDGAGRPVIFRHYLVFEADRDRAIALVKLHMTVNDGERVEVHEPVDRSKFLAQDEAW